MVANTWPAHRALCDIVTSSRPPVAPYRHLAHRCLLLPPAPGPPVRLVFPEVRLTSVRIVWQPPEEPNGIVLGKEAAAIKEIIAQRKIAITLISSVFITHQRG